MEASLWVAKTGLDAQQMRMTVISNNLANVNTTGFKRDRAVFEDLLYQNIRQPGGTTGGDNAAPTGLMMGTGVRIVATEKLHTQGSMIQTKMPWMSPCKARGCSKFSSQTAPWPTPEMGRSKCR
jgi:fagellar hook-basal body proteins